MATTYGELQTKVSRALQDPSRVTFVTQTVKDMIQAAWAEIGRIAPERFQEDITPLADTQAYQLRKVGTDQALTTPFGAASTNLLTSATHGLTAGVAIRFVALTGGTGLVVGLPYYVIASGLTADAFRLAPVLSGTQVDFTTDITAGTFVRIGYDDPLDEIEVQRVEVWDISEARHRAWRQVEPQSAHPIGLSYSQAGWIVWGGVLELPDRVVDMIDPAVHLIRVWGYSPWRPVVSDSDIVPFGREREEALVLYCHVEALRALTNSRTLFTQWQTRSGNTDVTPAALMNDLSLAQAEWQRRARQIFVIREAP